MVDFAKKLLKLNKIKRYLRLFFVNHSLSHKKEFHNNLKILHEKFHSDFFDEEGERKYQIRSCVNCKKDDSLKLIFCTPANFDFVQCGHCGMVMMNPMPSLTVLDKMYNSP